MGALGIVQRDLDLSDAAREWVVTGYLLTSSCLLIAGGRLADVHGCRRVLTTGQAVFAGASALIGLAGRADVLVAGRVVQGAGAALMVSAALVAVRAGRTGRQRAIGQVVWLAMSSLGTAVGPTVGGYVAEVWDWTWIFLVNVPIGVLAVVPGWIFLDGRGGRGQAVDLPGMLTSATVVFAVTWALMSAGDRQDGWRAPGVLAALAVAVAAAVAFVLVERRSRDPMVDLALFRRAVFAGGTVTLLMWGIGFNGLLYFGTIFLQDVLGFRPSEAGLAFLPPALTVMALAPVAFWLTGRLGPRFTIGGGMALMAAGMVAFTLLRRGDGFGDLMPGLALLGIGTALVVPLPLCMLQVVPDERVGVASGVVAVVRQVSGAFGIAVLGVVIDVAAGSRDPSGTEAFRQAVAAGLVFGAGLVLVGGLVGLFTLGRGGRPAGTAHGGPAGTTTPPCHEDREARR
ncbi:MFS transporter [Actinomadura sp. KC216]|nr:MFS transporter [Actinomadura sp. KC216]